MVASSEWRIIAAGDEGGIVTEMGDEVAERTISTNDFAGLLPGIQLSITAFVLEAVKVAAKEAVDCDKIGVLTKVSTAENPVFT